MPSIIRALPSVLILTVGSTTIHAQRLTCYPIRAGETAAGLAGQLTGDPRNRLQPWFQIVEPGIERYVPKREYAHIQAGWHVCVATERLSSHVLRPAYSSAPPASGVLLQTGFRPHDVWGYSIFWWTTSLVLLLTSAVALWIVTARHGHERRALVVAMRAFGKRFVDEFERPLFREHALDPVINSRLRCAPRRRRLEILVSPPAGRTYPNLADHRKNVEYDVERILAHLEDRQFVNGPPYAEGQWVVIPFQLKTGMHEEGGR